MKAVKEIKPTKEQFEVYIEIQDSGVTNMLDVDTVITLSKLVFFDELSKENLLYIYKHYSELCDEYNIER